MLDLPRLKDLENDTPIVTVMGLFIFPCSCVELVKKGAFNYQIVMDKTKTTIADEGYYEILLTVRDEYYEESLLETKVVIPMNL